MLLLRWVARWVAVAAAAESAERLPVCSGSQYSSWQCHAAGQYVGTAAGQPSLFPSACAVNLIAMATPEDMRADAEHIRMADQFVEVSVMVSGGYLLPHTPPAQPPLHSWVLPAPSHC